MTAPREKERQPAKLQIQSIVIAAIPALALTAGIPLANRVDPEILGLPFFIVYQTFWILMTPVFLYLLDRGRKRI